MALKGSLVTVMCISFMDVGNNVYNNQPGDGGK